MEATEIPEIRDISTDIDEMRRIYNAQLNDMPAEIVCRNCGKPKQLIPVNRRVAFWAHMDPDVFNSCEVKLTFRTSFIQSVARMWGHWKTPLMKALEGEDDYAKHWEMAYAGSADKFLRNDFELTKKDRQWLYANLEGPVLEICCRNCIDYEGFKA